MGRKRLEIWNIERKDGIAKRKIHTFISTGMSSEKDIDSAISIFKLFFIRHIDII